MNHGKYKPFITFPSDNENVFVYIGQGAELLKFCAYSSEEVAEFIREMTSSGSYEEAKAIMKKWFHVTYLKKVSQ